VALPTIVAEQNTQKVIASASEVTTASEDDYVLDIYGNANEDDTVDMRDLTYVKLIFFGKKPETELADAKYDGKINPLDFIQIKLIIVGKEKELTVVDSAKRDVTVPMPLERVIAMYEDPIDIIRALKAKDTIVGVPTSVPKNPEYWPDLHSKPVVGTPFELDYEKIIELNPQVVFCYIRTYEDAIEKLEPMIKVVRLDCQKYHTLISDIRIMGVMLDKEKEAEEYCDFCKSKFDLVEERIGKIKPEEKKTVYYEIGTRKYHSVGPGKYQYLIEMCGGFIIFAVSPAPYPDVSPEAVIARNPDVIIKDPIGIDGYSMTDESKLKEIREEIMKRTELAKVTAVKNGDVYVLGDEVSGSEANPLAVCYLAKLLYPNEFRDLDLDAFLKEFLEEYMGIPYQGIYIYPPLES
jgi:iron complex transport system substrate-binding protein